MVVIWLDYASGCNKSSKSSLLGLFKFIRRITCFGAICFVIKWFKIDMTNNNNDLWWEGWACRLEMNLGERTLPDTFVSDGHLRWIYDPQSNDKNQLSSLHPPARYTSSNIVPQGNGFPYPPSVYPPIIFQNLKCYQLPLFIRMREWNISHILWLHIMKYLRHWVPSIILIPNDAILIIHLIHIRGHPYFTIQIRVFDYVMMN